MHYAQADFTSLQLPLVSVKGTTRESAFWPFEFLESFESQPHFRMNNDEKIYVFEHSWATMLNPGHDHDDLPFAGTRRRTGCPKVASTRRRGAVVSSPESLAMDFQSSVDFVLKIIQDYQT